MNVEFLDNIASMKKLYGNFLLPVCQRHQVTRMELDILLFLANNRQYDTAKDMVEQRKLAKSHVSLSVSTLCEQGYLKKEYRNGNSKNAHLVLCPHAAEIVQEGQEAQKQFFAHIFRDFTKEELDLFDQVIRKIHRNVQLPVEKETVK